MLEHCYERIKLLVVILICDVMGDSSERIQNGNYTNALVAIKCLAFTRKLPWYKMFSSNRH